MLQAAEDSFGGVCRAIELTGRYVEDGEERGRVWTQDGPEIYAEDGEWFLQAHVWTRYYGIGYERGDILLICAVAEWCEANIPACSVWYGGDSSGVVAEPFGAPQREAIKRHFYGQSGRDYFAPGRFDSWIGPSRPTMPKACALCIPGHPRFVQYGSGAGYAAVSCQGCGKHFTSTDNGTTWIEKKEA